MFRGRVFVVHGTGLSRAEEGRARDLVARCVAARHLFGDTNHAGGLFLSRP